MVLQLASTCGVLATSLQGGDVWIAAHTVGPLGSLSTLHRHIVAVASVYITLNRATAGIGCLHETALAMLTTGLQSCSMATLVSTPAAISLSNWPSVNVGELASSLASWSSESRASPPAPL